MEGAATTHAQVKPWLRRHRSVLATLIASSGVFGGLLMALREPEDTRSAEMPSSVNASPERALPATPNAPPDPEISILGTNASTSIEQLRLVLVATKPGKTPLTGVARLGTDPRNPQTYAAGARLSNGAILKEVHPDFVVLARDGKQSLLFVAGKSARVSKRLQHIGVNSEVLSVGGEEAVNRPLERVSTTREDLSEVMRAEPYFERDAFAGLRIIAGTNRSNLALLGLQTGDIVRSIEGKRVESPDTAWQRIDDAVSTGTPIIIGIEREGTMMSISLDGSQLANPHALVNSYESPATPPGT